MSYKMNIDQASEKYVVEHPEVEKSGVNQPVTIQPDSSAAVVTPVTVVVPAASRIPIQTGCCECSDGPWWGYCCFGCWFHTCAGFFMNLKLDKNMS